MNLITILILGWFAQQTPIASIEGTVVQIGTAQPIAKAIVELSGGGGRSPLFLETNVDGKFAFQNAAGAFASANVAARMSNYSRFHSLTEA
jgi:hypothetical protein